MNEYLQKIKAKLLLTKRKSVLHICVYSKNMWIFDLEESYIPMSFSWGFINCCAFTIYTSFKSMHAIF